MKYTKVFIGIFLLISLPLCGQRGAKNEEVSKPKVYLNGARIKDEAVALGKDVISVTAGPGESIVLSFSYMPNVRKSPRDLKDGLLTAKQAENINRGAFRTAPAGTIWILSFFAVKNGIRGETEIVILTKGTGES